MTAKELMKLRNSNEAPYDHQEYTIWLHNKIIDKINYELWEYREKPNTIAKHGYAACNDIMSFQSLKPAT
jgi:hypothetical protein